MSSPIAVLLMAYGSPLTSDRAAVRAYLEHILQYYRRTSATDDEVDDLVARYRAVGGSPLYAITEQLVAGLDGALAARHRGRYLVRSAMKHSPPFIEDVVRRIAAAGHRQAVGVALAPFRSRLSTEGYFSIVRDANAALARPMEWCYAADWHLDDGFLRLWERRVRDAVSGDGSGRYVVFTNHSLPARIREWGDPYEEQFRATASALAKRLDLRGWTVAFQSAGGGNQAWLGPSLEHVLRERRAAGDTRFLVVPIGFLMDHLEVRYDLDVAAQRLAGELGIALTRTDMPNAERDLIEMLADVVERAAKTAAKTEEHESRADRDTQPHRRRRNRLRDGGGSM